MKLTVYDNFERFRERALPFLEHNPIVNNLMIGIILNIERYREIAPLTAIIENEGEVCLVVLRTPPHRIMLAGEGHQREAINLLIEYFEKENYSLPGVIGPEMVAECFAEQWIKTFSQGKELQTHLRVYRLDEVIWDGHVKGSIRNASKDDIKLVAEWVEAYRLELQLLVNLTDSHTWVVDEIKREQVYLWIVDGEAVSVAATGAPARKGIGVGSVYTPPTERRRGYASAMVAAVSQKMLDDGYQYCMLFADLSNSTTNKIYQNIGYRAVSDFKEIDFYLTE